jgi:drug/metabolite transporter (DMT)-like permease
MTERTRRAAYVAIALGLLSALFFSATYVLNRAAADASGDWLWTASLRYLFTLPLLLPLMAWQGGVAPVWASLRRHPLPWLLWSGIGFGLFYVCLAWAAATGPSWLIAGSFQLTVVAGMLCAPLLYRDARRRIPPAVLALAVVAVSAVAYPLGNRGLLLHLEHSGEQLNASQRVFGMTLASQPIWWLLAAFAYGRTGAPPLNQALLALGVAVFAGIIATVLFFEATGRVRNQPGALGAVEAMQAAEIIFASVLGAWLFGEALPGASAWSGAAIVMAGIIALGLLAGREAAGHQAALAALRSERGG